MSSVSRWIREPLFHFLVLGAALFAVFSVTSDRDQPGEGEIVVSAGKIEHLTALFARTWQRPPTRQELEGLINDYVREEAAYRRGMAMGLDQDDTIIRRRIRQKLDFIADDLASLAEPTEEELAAYLAEHPEDFRVDPSITFAPEPEYRTSGVRSSAGTDPNPSACRKLEYCGWLSPCSTTSAA